MRVPDFKLRLRLRSCEDATYSNPTDREGESFQNVSCRFLVRRLIHSMLPPAVTALGYVLCNPVGGIGNESSGSTSSIGNASTTGVSNPPVPSSFTGTASRMLGSEVGWIAMAMMGGLGPVVFL